MENEAVVIADDSLVPDPPGRGEHEAAHLLQFVEDVLVRDGRFRTGWLLAPGRDKDRDLLVATGSKPLNSQQDAFAGEHMAVSMPTGGINKSHIKFKGQITETKVVYIVSKSLALKHSESKG